MEYANITLSGKLMFKIKTAQGISDSIAKAIPQLDLQIKNAILGFLSETKLDGVVRDNETDKIGRFELERTGDKIHPYRLVFGELLDDGRIANKKERVKVWLLDAALFDNLKAVSQAYTAIVKFSKTERKQ